MKNIVQGIMLSGILIAVSPLIFIAYKHGYDLFVGSGLSYERNMGALALLFTLPGGLMFSLCGLVLESILSSVSPSYKESLSNRLAVVSIALFIGFLILLFLLGFKFAS